MKMIKSNIYKIRGKWVVNDQKKRIGVSQNLNWLYFHFQIYILSYSFGIRKRLFIQIIFAIAALNN